MVYLRRGGEIKPEIRFFNKFFNSLSEKAKRNLVYKPYEEHPMSMNVINIEIRYKTKLGNKILKELFEDEN